MASGYSTSSLHRSWIEDQADEALVNIDELTDYQLSVLTMRKLRREN